MVTIVIIQTPVSIVGVATDSVAMVIAAIKTVLMNHIVVIATMVVLVVANVVLCSVVLQLF